MNSHIAIHTYTERLTLTNAERLISQYDIIADCSDNFYTRYLINDVCFFLEKPYVFASVQQFKGHCSVFLGKTGPCFRCLFPELSDGDVIPTCNEVGVLGVLPGIMGVIQATEIIKWILKAGDLLINQLLTVDLLKMKFEKIFFSKSFDCAVCVHHTFYASLAISDIFENKAISMIELQHYLKQANQPLLLDVRTDTERNEGHLGGILIPLDELPKRLDELDRFAAIIVYCQTGKRSLQAVKLLIEADFHNVKYLKNGYNSKYYATTQN